MNEDDAASSDDFVFDPEFADRMHDHVNIELGEQTEFTVDLKMPAESGEYHLFVQTGDMSWVAWVVVAISQENRSSISVNRAAMSSSSSRSSFTSRQLIGPLSIGPSSIMPVTPGSQNVDGVFERSRPSLNPAFFDCSHQGMLMIREYLFGVLAKECGQR